MEQRCRCYCWSAKGPHCQEHAGPAAGWEFRPGWEGPLSKQDSRPVESITQLISRKTASGKRNFPSHSKKSKKTVAISENCWWKQMEVLAKKWKGLSWENIPHATGHHRGLRGQFALENQPRSLLWEAQHLLTASIFLLFWFCLHFFSSPFLLRWKQQKKINKTRRQLSCNYHSHKKAKQGSKKWFRVITT